MNKKDSDKTRRLTEKTISKSPSLQKARKEGDHVGHKTTLKEGLAFGLTPEMLSDRKNLERQTPEKNLKQGSNSTQSPSALKNKINKNKKNK